jgi:enoyl-CoA hydratase
MLTKRVLQANVDAGSLRQAIEVENRGQTLATRGEDFREALSAFREKRRPSFAGR